MNRFQNPGKVVSFLLILSLMLLLVSEISVRLDRDSSVLYDHTAVALFIEPKNSVDVVVIGDSNVYSSVFPLLWWKECGITGYAWGNPSQRIFETYEDLKKIFRHQKPKVVFIEVGNLFREKTYADNVDSLIKARMEAIFPVIRYHQRLDSHRISSYFYTGRSITKGYYLKEDVKAVHKNPIKEKLRAVTEKEAVMNPISRKYLKKCIEYCRQNGAKAVLLFVPSYGRWNYKRHNTLLKEARKEQVEYLDLNLLLADSIDWNKDSADRGEHLNVFGAEKVTNYLGTYLYEHEMVQDHRNDEKYRTWDYDLIKFITLAEKFGCNFFCSLK